MNFRPLIESLIHDEAVAGITLTTVYESLTGVTVTPPAGTIRQGGEVVGLFTTATGETAATIDSWGSQASRCEALLATRCTPSDHLLANEIGYPLVIVTDEEGRTLTTSAELSHRQADATWRLLKGELETKGINFKGIQQATRDSADALLIGFPTAIPFGWWHSHTKRSRSQKAGDNPGKNSSAKKPGRTKKVDDDAMEAICDDLDYYVMDPSQSRSARLFTSEIMALGVSERRRRAGRVDRVFGGAGGEVGGKRLSVLGLGSLPPTEDEDKMPSDLTYRTIEGHAFLSLTGLRSFQFEQVDEVLARTLVVCLTLLLYTTLQHHLDLRAGAELRVVEPGTRAQVARHGAAPEPLELPAPDELRKLVRTLGREAGWPGKTTTIVVSPTSPLGKLLNLVDGGK